MKKLSLIAILAAVLGFSVPAQAGENTFFGTGVGAALGGLLGSQFGHGDGRLAYTGLGVFTGGLIGNSMGRSMDRANAMYASRYYSYGPSYYSYSAPAYYQPTYVAPPAPPPRVVYVQPEVVEYRSVAVPTVVEEGPVGASRYCREFTQQIRIDGKVQESYGTACLQPDGTWRVER